MSAPACYAAVGPLLPAEAGAQCMHGWRSRHRHHGISALPSMRTPGRCDNPQGIAHIWSTALLRSVNSMPVPAACGAHLDPDAGIPPHAPHQVLKLLALAQPVLCKLRLICDLLLGRLEVLLLQLLGLAQDLLRGDLRR